MFLPYSELSQRDGRVLFVSSAECHGDDTGAQQAKDRAQVAVAPVLRLRGRPPDLLRAVNDDRNGAGSFTRFSY
jgi:hypothetical protein